MAGEGGLFTLVCSQIDELTVKCNGTTYTEGDHLDAVGSLEFYRDMGLVGALVLTAGLMSGLTMGLMSLDKLNLTIVKNSGDDTSKTHASRILPLVERHHWLLVTLLLTNAAAAEALPIFLDRLVPSYLAIIISVSLVLLFGEIIPQAVCTRYGLQVGSYMSWPVWFLMFVLSPVAWPIAKLLDLTLGADHGTFFRRNELKELVHLHAEDANNPMTGEPLTDDEVRIIRGAIDLKEKTVREVMTNVETVFAINIDDVLDRTLLQKIVDSGHDRIPVYHWTREHFVGIISVKNLVMLDPNAKTLVRDLKLYRVPLVPGDMPLYDLLHQFQNGRSHLAIVLDPENYINPLGIITLEDLIEELLQAELLDEDDIRRQKIREREEAFAKDSRLQGYLHRPSIFGAPGRRNSMISVPTSANNSFAGLPGIVAPPKPNASGRNVTINDDRHEDSDKTPLLGGKR